MAEANVVAYANTIASGKLHVTLIACELHNEMGEREFEGVGYIQQNNEGMFILKLIGSTPAKDFRQKANQNIPHERTALFTFEGMGESGRKWSSGHPFVAHIHNVFEAHRPRFEVRAVLSAVVCEDTCKPADSQFEGVVSDLGIRQFPLSRKTTVEKGHGDNKTLIEYGRSYRCEIGESEIVLERLKEDGLIHVVIKRPPRLRSLERVLDALQILSSTVLAYRVEMRCNEGNLQLVLHSGTRSFDTRRPRPVPIEDFWTAFAKLVEHLWDLGGLDISPDPASSTLLNAGLASTGTQANETLTLCVGIEAVLPLWSLSDMKAGDQMSDEDVKKISAAIQGTDVATTIKARATGMITGLRTWRAIDRLRRLNELGLVTEEQIAAWSRYRNTAAHGNPKLVPPAGRGHLWTLLHLTALRALNYQGAIIDYGAKPDSVAGWVK